MEYKNLIFNTLRGNFSKNHKDIGISNLILSTSYDFEFCYSMMSFSGLGKKVSHGMYTTLIAGGVAVQLKFQVVKNLHISKDNLYGNIKMHNDSPIETQIVIKDLSDVLY